MAGIGESKHLVSGCGIGGFPEVNQTRSIAMMTVGYDAVFIKHHFCDCVDIVFGGYSKEAVPDVLFIEEIYKWFPAGSFFDNFLCDILLIFVKHEDQAEVGSSRSFKVKPVGPWTIERLFMGPDTSFEAEFLEFR